MGVVRAGISCMACTWLLIAAENPQADADTRCEAGANSCNSSIRERHVASNNDLKFAIGGRTRFIMRRVNPPEGAIDFRVLGEAGAPAILSLIVPDPDRYADYTYNGSDADVDVSYGGLNLRPLMAPAASTSGR